MSDSKKKRKALMVLSDAELAAELRYRLTAEQEENWRYVRQVLCDIYRVSKEGLNQSIDNESRINSLDAKPIGGFSLFELVTAFFVGLAVGGLVVVMIMGSAQ